MLMSMLSHILSAWFAFLLPCYSTFKALSHRPLSESDLEKWAMYWTVIGGFVAFEYVAEWILSWFPFYWELKTLFLLFLSLPQTQGSTFVYQTYVEPFFTANEADLDAGIASAQQNIFVFFQNQAGGVIDAFWRLVNKSPASGHHPAEPGQPQQGPSIAPGFSLDSAMGLWRTYGPSVMGTFQRQPTQPRSSPPAPSPSTTSTSSLQANHDVNTWQRAPRTPESDPVLPHRPIGTPSPSAYSSTPSFPEPQIN